MEAENKVRAMALAYYDRTNEPKPTPGAHVKLFEKIAKATPLDFVEKKQVARVTLRKWTANLRRWT
jgi:hypothetical protein